MMFLQYISAAGKKVHFLKGTGAKIVALSVVLCYKPSIVYFIRVKVSRVSFCFIESKFLNAKRKIQILEGRGYTKLTKKKLNPKFASISVFLFNNTFIHVHSIHAQSFSLNLRVYYGRPA